MLGRCFAFACAATALAASPASAGTLTVTDDGMQATVAYTAAPLEANVVDVTFDGTTLVVSDAGRAIVASPLACTTTIGEARCAISGELAEVRAELGDGADTFTATLASDDFTALVVDGGQGRDVLHGDTDERWHWSSELYGGAGNDVLHGGPDWETLDGGTGADDMHGGPGEDTVTYRDRVGSVAHPARLGVVVTLDDVADDGIAVPGHAATEDDNAHSDIENIFGSTGPDRLYGTEVYNFIQGRDGDDLIVIDQGGDVDSALGGVGDDTIHARDGLEDYVNCDPGEDTFVGDAIDTASRCETMDLG